VIDEPRSCKEMVAMAVNKIVGLHVEIIFSNLQVKPFEWCIFWLVESTWTLSDHLAYLIVQFAYCA